MKIEFFNLDKLFDYKQELQLVGTREGNYFEKKDLLELIIRLQKANERQDINQIIDILSKDKNNKRVISYMRKIKHEKTAKKYFNAVDSCLNDILSARLCAFHFRAAYKYEDEILYVNTKMLDNLTAENKAFKMTRDNFFEVFFHNVSLHEFVDFELNSDNRIDEIHLSRNIKVSVDFYLKHRDNLVESYVKEILRLQDLRETVKNFVL